MKRYQSTRDAHSIPMYEFTASSRRSSPRRRGFDRWLQAGSHGQPRKAMDGFARVNAGVNLAGGVLLAGTSGGSSPAATRSERRLQFAVPPGGGSRRSRATEAPMARTRSVSPRPAIPPPPRTFPLWRSSRARPRGLGRGLLLGREHAEGPPASLAGLQGVEVQVFRIATTGCALSSPRTVSAPVREVAPGGGLRVLTPEERARMPDEPQLWSCSQAARIGPGRLRLRREPLPHFSP